MSTSSLPATQAQGLLSQSPGALLLDVRTPAEFSARRAAGARNIPLDTIASQAGTLPREAPILILCETGARAVRAASTLRGLGFDNLRVVEGGTEAWAARGLPVEGTGRTVLGIERQVRIGAGSLVVLGVILGFTVERHLFLLSGLIGAGLVFAGVTGWCGLALLLAKAPWNR
jgi:rhodanese-related sulfurtransferase